MEKVKKLGAVLLAVTMAATISACGDTKPWAQSKENLPAASTAPESGETSGASSEMLSPEDPPSSAEAEEAETAGKSGGFDQQLAGSWAQVSKESSGDKEFNLGTRLSFLHDGSFFGDILGGDFHDIVASGLECPKAATDGDTIQIFEEIADFAIQRGQTTQKDASKYDLSITYELGDIRASLSDEDGIRHKYDGWYEKYDQDKLVFHLKGKIRETPTTIATIDSVLTYERIYPAYIYNSEDYFDACLYGSWKDSMGNAWTFDYNEGGSLRAVLTDTDGDTYTDGTVMDSLVDLENGTESVYFFFDGDSPFTTPTYLIRGFDGTVLSLEDKETGEAFTMTKNTAKE